jgi:hypothetical protein
LFSGTVKKTPCFQELSKIALFSGTVKNRLVFWNCQKSPCFLELSKIALFSGTVKNHAQKNQIQKISSISSKIICISSEKSTK